MLLTLISLPNYKEKESLLVTDELPTEGLISLPIEQPLKIAILGGIQFLDPSLMIDCLGEETDFRLYNNIHHTVGEFSKPMMDEVISKVLKKKPDLLLIPGDLSYNGEEISHNTIAGILKEVSNQGIKVFVIPGIEDILNPLSFAYNGNGHTTTPTIMADRFAEIYSDFGYADAIARDPNSLSYLAQPFDNIWILGIDDRFGTIDHGAIKPETMEWILGYLAEAKENNITVFGLLHHSVTEDWPGMAGPGHLYVIQNHEYVENALTDAGLKIIFTAHAIDITRISKGENTLYDIGSLGMLIPPFSFRMIYLEQNSMEIETHFIKSIDAPIPGGVSLLDYSNAYVEQNLIRRLNSYPDFMKPYGARAIMDYYAGDEKLSSEDRKVFEAWPLSYKNIMININTDLPPEDRQYTLDIQ